MGLFRKSKKNSDCCNIQFEELKDEKQSGKDNGCCEFKIEELPQDKEKDDKGKGCCD
ncbi:MAG: hypothetical protein MI866_14510 [Bacteroidales bacterium]|nr:hypothetical protein [Bacteroidales bacterium]